MDIDQVNPYPRATRSEFYTSTPGASSADAPHKSATRAEYSVNLAAALRSAPPSGWRSQDLAAAARLDRSYLERVPEFTVGRHGVGEVMFLGATDVRALDLDAIVDINPSEVSVYMGASPPVGKGLNKPAHVTLYGVFPKLESGVRGRTEEPALLEKFRRKLEKRKGCTLLSYEPEHGVWRFGVEHFSR